MSGYKAGLLFLFVFALSIRLFYLYEIKNFAAFEILLGDAESYDHWAREISGGNWLGSRVFYQSPFYPYFLGIIYSVVGRDLFFVRMIQMVMGALSCLFLAGAGGSFFNKKIGLLSGLLLSVYPTVIFFDGSIQKTGLGLFLTTLLLLLLGGINRNPRARLWLFSGIVMGCLGLVRENSLVLFPIIMLWLFVHFGRVIREKRFFWLFCFVLGLSMVLLPVGFRNKIVGDAFVLTTAQFGTNFYIGNNKTADGLYRELAWSRGNWHYERSDAVLLAEKEKGRHLGPAEVSDFWFKKALSDIRSDPFSWIHLMLKKWVFLWNATEIGDTESQYAYYRWSFVLNITGKLFHFGVLCPLALSGLWLTWESRRRLWLLYLILFGYAASVSLFYIFARYRVPMVPILSLFAAAGIVKCSALFHEKNVKKLLICGALVLLTAVFVNRGKIPSAYFAATTYNNLAICLENTRPEKAHAFYSEAVRLHPTYVKAYFRQGCFLMKQGQFRNATDSFLMALRIHPENDMIHYYAGLSYLERDEPHAALYHFSEAVRINKDAASVTFYKIAVAYAMLNNVDASMVWFEKAVQNGFTDIGLITREKDIGPETKESFIRTLKGALTDGSRRW